MFTTFTFLGERDSFIRGYLAGSSGVYDYDDSIGAVGTSLQDNNIFSCKDYFGERGILIFGLLAFVGVIIYILSKEKIEDDYINRLRLESYQLSFLIITTIALILYLFNLSQEIEMGTAISFLLGTYLIIFAIKKRTI